MDEMDTLIDIITSNGGIALFVIITAGTVAGNLIAGSLERDRDRKQDRKDRARPAAGVPPKP